MSEPAARADGSDELEQGPQAALLAAQTSAPLAEGTQIGEYRVTSIVGAGGMATVYAGVHPLIGKRVAIKVLHSRYAADATIAERFLREAQAVNQVDSELLVDIFAVGTLPDGRPYLVMDFLEGESLSELINREGALPLPLALTVFSDVARGLIAAHDAGIVHRDLKPSNIMVRRTEDDRVLTKIVDFGIAKLLPGQDDTTQPEGWTTTQTGVAIGTGPYMSPEQLAGEVDHRTDIWALGVTFYRALTGVLPYEADSFSELVELHDHPPPLPSLRRGELPVELDALIGRCLTVDRGSRLQSMREVLEALEALRDEHRALPASVPRGRMPWVVGGIALLLLGGAAGATIALWPGQRPQPEEATQITSPAGADLATAAPARADAPARRFVSLTVTTGLKTATYMLDGKLVGAGATLRLPKLPPGSYTLRISAPGYISQEKQLVAHEGSVWNMHVQLKKGRGVTRSRVNRPARSKRKPSAKTLGAATSPAKPGSATGATKQRRVPAVVRLAGVGRKLTPIIQRGCRYPPSLPAALRKRELKRARLVGGSYTAYARRAAEAGGKDPVVELKRRAAALGPGLTRCLRLAARCQPQLWELTVILGLGPSGAVKQIIPFGKPPAALKRCLGKLLLRQALPPPRPGRAPRLTLKFRAY